MSAVQDALFGPETTRTTPTHVLSWGLGADSTAILLRWLHEPASRDFDLDQLVIVVAQVGDEYPSTIRDAEEVVLPLLASHGVRLVQAGRTRRNTTAAGEGISIFSDTTQPTRLLAAEGYALSEELLTAATVPQLGSRRCSLRAKGAVLDPIIARLTAGHPFRHYIGFETGELRRAERDATYNTDLRRGEYPLLSWSWSRTDALDYLYRVTGRRWQKSACSFCPFQFASKAGMATALDRYRQESKAGAHALYLEHVAARFNPRQGLLAGGRLMDTVRSAGLTEVLDIFAGHLAAQEHGLYEVRRVATARRDAKASIARSVRQIQRGPVAHLHAALEELPGELVTGDDGITRLWRHHRGDVEPWVEHFHVVAPTVDVQDKQRPGFEAMYAAATGGIPALL